MHSQQEINPIELNLLYSYLKNKFPPKSNYQLNVMLRKPPQKSLGKRILHLMTLGQYFFHCYSSRESSCGMEFLMNLCKLLMLMLRYSSVNLLCSKINYTKLRTSPVLSLNRQGENRILYWYEWNDFLSFFVLEFIFMERQQNYTWRMWILRAVLILYNLHEFCTTNSPDLNNLACFLPQDKPRNAHTASLL